MSIRLPVPRAAAGRPSSDPECAGCGLLSVLRGLRRAGVEVHGAIGCDGGGAGSGPAPAFGRWAAVTGLDDLGVRGAGAVAADAFVAGAAVVVIADRLPAARSLGPEDGLLRSVRRLVRLDLSDPAGVEARVREALDLPGTVLLALAPCAREAPRSHPLQVNGSLCNRCGACVSLGCPALSDPGLDAMRVDPETCTGCALCAALCRSRAIGPAGPLPGGSA